VFFSYSHKDKKWLERFQSTLKPLIRVNQISVWDDTKIKAGDIWRDEIKQALATSKVAVLLVSTNFLNSDFIAENELPPLLVAAQNEGLRILLVIVGHSLFEETELGRYQAVNDPSRPLAKMSAASREQEIVRICKEIKAAVTSTEDSRFVGPATRTRRDEEFAANKATTVDKGDTTPGNITDAVRTTSNVFPHIPLSPEAELWLRAVYARLLSGTKVNPVEILVDLWGEIPEDFNYKSIDRRLLLFGVDITLLGILHVDPTTDLIDKTDLVIRFVKGLIKEQPGVEEVTAKQVAETIQMPVREVSIVFGLLRHLGKFWNGGSGNESGMTLIRVDYEEVKREYLKYKGIEHLLDKLYKDKGGDEYGEVTRLSSLEAITPDTNLSGVKNHNVMMSTNVQDRRNVFVVHGRNLDARNSLFRFLRSIGLRPVEWSQAIQLTGKASPFIGDVLDVAFSVAQAIVVLMTPDDEARLRESFRSKNDPPQEAQLTGQARPNVLFEAGMAMGRNPDRTIIVELGTLRPFSDIAGRHIVRLNNDSASRHELAQRLETAGCAVDLSGRDWHTEGNFNFNSLSSVLVTQAINSDSLAGTSWDFRQVLTEGRLSYVVVYSFNSDGHGHYFSPQEAGDFSWEQEDDNVVIVREDGGEFILTRTDQNYMAGAFTPPIKGGFKLTWMATRRS
jgi:predicted nucleotide-binding protein